MPSGRPQELVTYPKVFSLSALIAYNAMNYLGGAAISFCT